MKNINLISYLFQTFGCLLVIFATFKLALATKSSHRLLHEKFGIKEKIPNAIFWLLGVKKITNDGNATLGIVWPAYDSALRLLVWGMIFQLIGNILQFANYL